MGAKARYPLPAVRSLQISQEQTRTGEINRRILHFPSFEEMMALLAYANSRFALAA
jgi:hypothetical protein